MSEFRRAFGRGLSAEFIAELYVAREFGLEIRAGANEAGYDAIGKNGERYQIKFRAAQNVDVNNFDFDYLVLVNLDSDYHLIGMWRLTVAQAIEIFKGRGDKHRKYQANQQQVKRIADRIR